MIVTLIILAIAFVWLLKETDCLRVRLPVGTSLKVATVSESQPATIPQVSVKPSVLEVLDMPATTGNINIICVRE